MERICRITKQGNATTNHYTSKRNENVKGKKLLGKMVLLGLLFSNITVSVGAANDIEYHGSVNIHGNAPISIPTDPNIDNINIMVNDVQDGYYTDTTAALIFNKNKEIYNVTGNVSVINTIMDERVDNNDAVYVMNGTTVNINSDKIYIATIGGQENRNGGAALAAKDSNNKITVTGNTVQLIGNIDFYDLFNSNNEVVVKLTSANSFWYGDEKKAILGNNNILDITLANGAEWIYNSNDSISSLTLEKGGIVNLQDEDIQNKYNATVINDGTNTYNLADFRSEASHQKVTIEELKGSGGIFKADIDWISNSGAKKETANSDYVYIEKSETGSTQVLSFDAAKSNIDKMNMGDRLYFANVEDGNTAFKTESSVYSNAANVFNYEYAANSESGQKGDDWFIELTGKTNEGNGNVDAAKGMMHAGYALATEMDRLNKRMGEARYFEDDHGMWVRYRHSRTGWDNAFETDSDMIQLGYDKKTEEENGVRYRGLALDYTDADTSLDHISGDGDLERYALSLYDTWLGDKGHYYDFVIRGGRINSDYDIDGYFTGGMASLDSEYHQWFGSVSIEYGRKKDMNKGWYFEPQAQLQLARVGGADFTTSSGVKASIDSVTSFIGRAGFRLGREYVRDDGKRNNYYIKADVLHEFAGDRSFSLTGFDGTYLRDDNGTDTWFDVGIGADISIGKDTYFWADLERVLGSDFDDTWQINTGLRWEW